MTGLTALVPVAELLAEVTGSRAGAVEAAVNILNCRSGGLPQGHDDVAVAARQQLLDQGVITAAGVVDTGRAAELVSVCHILAAASSPVPAIPPDPRLVLSAPEDAVLLRDNERLEGLVLDVIRLASRSLHIGGAFWNEDGFGLLEEVLRPALTDRKITTIIYANVPDPAFAEVLKRRLGDLSMAGPAAVRWFIGHRPRMLHAKFVVADRRRGYLGTANLTSWGLREHIEAGVELTAGQSERFVLFLEQLEAAGLFSVVAPT